MRCNVRVRVRATRWGKREVWDLDLEFGLPGIGERVTAGLAAKVVGFQFHSASA
jgi:hypothetical protein